MSPTELTERATTDVVDESVEKLRRILSRQQQRDVSYNEAQEVGESLITFYQTLADEGNDGANT